MLGYTRFRFSDWQTTINRLKPDLSIGEVEQKLKTLFDYGVVFVPKIGGKGGGTSFEFVYQDRYLDPRFDADLVVHPALRKQLDLRDTKAGSKLSQSDPAESLELDFDDDSFDVIE